MAEESLDNDWAGFPNSDTLHFTILTTSQVSKKILEDTIKGDMDDSYARVVLG